MKVYVLMYQTYEFDVYKAVYATVDALLKDYPGTSANRPPEDEWGHFYLEQELL